MSEAGGQPPRFPVVLLADVEGSVDDDPRFPSA
jgi:hypothetical protein